LGGGKGNGGVRGVQYTANLGPEWTGICATTQRRDFQVSKGGISKQVREGFPSNKRGCQKGVRGMHLYVYIVLIKDCV
jgi:hypothetical protein